MTDFERAVAQATYREAAKRFLQLFECVFHRDWKMSQGVITDPLYIATTGTFLNPGVKDPYDNWANRGALLDTYHELKMLDKSASRKGREKALGRIGS